MSNLVPRPMYEKNDNKFVRAEQCAAQPSFWVGKINMNCIKLPEKDRKTCLNIATSVKNNVSSIGLSYVS